MFREHVRRKTSNGDEYFVWRVKWLNVYIVINVIITIYAVLKNLK